MRAWSTDDVPVEQRVDHWALALATTVVAMDVQVRATAGFGGRLQRVHSDDLAYVQLAAGPHVAVRTPVDIVGDGSCPFLLLVQGSQPWSLRQDGRLLHLRAGDVVLVDSSVPFELHHPHACSGLAVVLPRAWAGRWLPDLDSTTARVIWKEQGWGRTLSALCLQLAEDPFHVLAYPQGQLDGHVGALVAASLAPRDSARSPAASDVAERARATMKKQLHRPGLTATDLARELGLSVRTLHRAFGARGLTVAGVLRELRLAQAADLLARRELAALSIADIGGRCGFSDPSHFAREFRRAWQASPAQWRRDGARGRDLEPPASVPARAPAAVGAPPAPLDEALCQQC